MSEQPFRTKEIKLDGTGTPTIESPSTLSVTATTTNFSGGINVSGIATATKFSGDGSLLTNLPNSGGGGGSSNLFSTIAVSGQSNVVADSTSDTLTFVAGSNMTITTNAGTDTITFASTGGGGGGGSLGSRSTTSASTSSIAQTASANITIPTAGKSFSLLKVAIDAPAYVILYTDSTSRSNDSSRSEGTDPTPGSGVLTEVSTTSSGASTFLMTPAVLGWNNDGTPAAQIYAKVVNKRASSGSNAITVTLTTVALEA
tara:strand:- start:1931 stop:2704 length:774 start_codon:yes stop_codon:yes gene_type:complete